MVKVLVGGRASGTVLRSGMPINFLGAVDRETGTVTDGGHDLSGRSVAGTILAFPSGAGSSVGAYTIHSIKANGCAPLAMICTKADLSVVTGCAVAGIPLVIASDEEFAGIEDGKEMTVDTESAGGLG